MRSALAGPAAPPLYLPGQFPEEYDRNPAENNDPCDATDGRAEDLYIEHFLETHTNTPLFPFFSSRSGPFTILPFPFSLF